MFQVFEINTGMDVCVLQVKKLKPEYKSYTACKSLGQNRISSHAV